MRFDIDANEDSCALYCSVATGAYFICYAICVNLWFTMLITRMILFFIVEINRSSGFACAKWYKPLILLGVQKRVLLWPCSDKMILHYGVIYSPIGRRFGPRFWIKWILSWCWLVNIYRILDGCCECGSHFYFTFHLFICREIERLIIINNKLKKINNKK